MNPAEVATSLLIEKTLARSPAYRKVDDSLYVIKQGSAYVMINVVPWGKDKAMVRCTAQLVKGMAMDAKLALQLLELNEYLRFGAFAWDPQQETVLLVHSILGGATLFAGEIYVHSFLNNASLEMLAPIGGALAIVGWIVLAFAKPA